MIVGIGTDIVIIERISQNIVKYGDCFARKILTEKEFAQMPKQNQRRQAEWLAAHFACKEAAVKALGTGFSEGIVPSHVEILRDEGKAPTLTFLDLALDKAKSLGVTHCHVSYSHEKEHAVAFVTLEKSIKYSLF